MVKDKLVMGLYSTNAHSFLKLTKLGNEEPRWALPAPSGRVERATAAFPSPMGHPHPWGATGDPQPQRAGTTVERGGRPNCRRLLHMRRQDSCSSQESFGQQVCVWMLVWQWLIAFRGHWPFSLWALGKGLLLGGGTGTAYCALGFKSQNIEVENLWNHRAVTLSICAFMRHLTWYLQDGNYVILMSMANVYKNVAIWLNIKWETK